MTLIQLLYWDILISFTGIFLSLSQYCFNMLILNQVLDEDYGNHLQCLLSWKVSTVYAFFYKDRSTVILHSG